jgi:hypothetical protein
MHLLYEIDAQSGIHQLVKKIKGVSSHPLRTELPVLKSRLPTLPTNSYFVSTVAGNEAMSTKVGHFEILGEQAKSPTGTVDKPTDPQSNQAIALKVIQLHAFGDRAETLTTCVTVRAVLSLGQEGRAWTP